MRAQIVELPDWTDRARFPATPDSARLRLELDHASRLKGGDKMKAKTVEPPQRRGRRAEPVDEELRDTAAQLLNDGKPASDGRSYRTRGRAQSAGQRLRNAIVDEFEFTTEQIAVRAWGEGEDHRFAVVSRKT